MELIKRENNAPFIMVFGETNSGKSCSIVLTAPQPIMYISVENDVWKSVDVADQQFKDGIRDKKVDITAVIPKSHEDLMDSLNEMIEEAKDGKFKYKTAVFDSGTFWMNVKLTIRLEDDRNVGRVKKGHDEFGKLSAQTKKDYTEVNTANSQMSRLTNLLKILSGYGVMVIMTAQLQEHPKWNSELEAAPDFNYKEYNKALKGYFDYIGFTISNLAKDDDDNIIIPHEVVYPPNLSFSGEQGYLVKWRGVQPKKLITKFDLSKRFAWFCK